MSIKIDHVRALKVLEQESTFVTHRPITHPWVARVEKLSRLCERGAKTHIAMLGTAILARATDPRADVFSLKVSAGSTGAYSARSLAKNVLAAHAPRLGIDLGVSGREPLNNQPYFREQRVGSRLRRVVRSDGLPAYDHLVECLQVLSVATPREATLALRAFLQVRKRTRQRVTLPEGTPFVQSTALASAIDAWVAENSEGGKRAQAAVAGILDGLYHPGLVRVDRINDPDRHFPGDAAVLCDDGIVRSVYEVRDKPVTVEDLFQFADKVSATSIRRAAVIAVARHQAAIPLGDVSRFALEQGVVIVLYQGWRRLLDETLFFGPGAPAVACSRIPGYILDRAQDLEVSSRGVSDWLVNCEKMRE